MGLTLLAQAGMQLHYWWDAFSAAVHLINRLPTPTLQNLSPLEALFKQKPDYQMTNLRLFLLPSFNKTIQPTQVTIQSLKLCLSWFQFKSQGL